jgi:FAD/FMN-containing dehydrogenase
MRFRGFRNGSTASTGFEIGCSHCRPSSSAYAATRARATSRLTPEWRPWLRAIAWCRQTARRLGEHSLNANYVNEQADTGIARSAYGEGKYRRLAELKARYDPTNVFRLNQNIAPLRP